MAKLKLYLDSTIFGYSINEKEFEKWNNANKLLSLINEGKYDGFISDVILEEIERAPEWIKDKLLDKLRTTKLIVLPITSDIREYADKYIQRNIIPEEFLNDAIHVAVATFNKIDSIISYNFKHLVRLEIEIAVNEVNMENNKKEIHICPPEEVVS